MQIKTIEKNISAKMTEWLETITDVELRKEVKKNLLVSGGCIASMLQREPVNDYDVYLQDMDVVVKLAIYYTKDVAGVQVLDGRAKAKRIKELELEGNQDFDDQHNSFATAIRNLKENQVKLFFKSEKGGLHVNMEKDVPEKTYKPLFLSPNAISLSDNLQIVLRFSGTPQQIHKTFDFVHATNYFTFADGMVRNLAAMESLLTKQLKYQGSLYPLTSIIRTKKFIKRGFNISAGELLKIMFQISELNLNDFDVMEEQLIGVDVAYFGILIDALRDHKDAHPEFNLSSGYLNTLIDKVFSGSDETI